MRKTRERCRGFFVPLVVSVFCSQLWQTRAQQSEVLPEAERIPRLSSKEVMERPVGLTKGAGRMHQKVSTTSAEAQAYYDQGVAYLHS